MTIQQIVLWSQLKWFLKALQICAKALYTLVDRIYWSLHAHYTICNITFLSKFDKNLNHHHDETWDTDPTQNQKDKYHEVNPK